MRFAPLRMIDRRIFLASAIGAWASAAAAAGRPAVVTILGDSITAGYGLQARDALPAQLQAALGRLGVRTEVRGAGVSGDTTAGGLARVDFSVQPDTALAIVALGGNDLLQGLEPAEARANLTAIARRLRARGMRVLLCGLRAPARLNARYAREFDAAFPAAARQAAVPLYPDLLAGVEQIPALNQRDGVHPNPTGVKIIAARLAPVAARALRGRS